MPRNKREGSIGTVRGSMVIPMDVLNRLRSAEVPSGFLRLAPKFAIGRAMLSPTTAEHVSTSGEIEVRSTMSPTVEIPGEPEFFTESGLDVLPDPELQMPVEAEVPPEPPKDVRTGRGAETVYLTDLKLDLSRVAHMTPGLVALAEIPLEWITRGTFFLDEDADVPCLTCRLVILVGGMRARDGEIEDDDIKGAQKWAVNRATQLSKGGDCFQLWKIPFSIPFPERVFVQDISGGTAREAVQYTEKGTKFSAIKSFSEMFPKDSAGLRRIDELVIFQHGVKKLGEKNREEKVIQALRKLLVEVLKIPVCRLVYWSCNAAVNLDIAPGSPIDGLMKDLAKLSHQQQNRCGCKDRVELIKPTDGKCGIRDPTQLKELSTGDGRVIRVRWDVKEEPTMQDPQPPVRDEEVLDVPIVEDPTLK